MHLVPHKDDVGVVYLKLDGRLTSDDTENWQIHKLAIH